MVFDHSRNVDASGSNFNQVGGNQTNNAVTVVHNHFNLSLFGSRHVQLEPIHKTIQDIQAPIVDATLTTTPSQASSQLQLISHPPSCASIQSSITLIVQIIHLLLDYRDISDAHRELQLELKTLHQTLLLTSWAVEEYENRLFGPGLVNIAIPEAQKCHAVLQELYDKIDNTRQGLVMTRIDCLWRSVWWSRWYSELIPLKAELSRGRRSLAGFLLTLNSVARTEFGDDLCSSNPSFRQFHAMLTQRLPSLGHVQIDSIQVLDHLGRNIPVPTLFCSSWKDFDYVINGYCKNRIGDSFIERGDYQVVRAEDTRVINPSEFAAKVKSGMKVEISIVLRRNADFKDAKTRCPRCRYVNFNVASISNWIECSRCSAQFQVAVEEYYGNQVTKPTGSEDNVESPPEEDIEEIISPDSQRTEMGDDGTQYFRRMNVIFPKAPYFAETYLVGERIYGCSACKTHLTTIHFMLSRAFNGLHGRGYLFERVVNVIEGEIKDTLMTTGHHSTQDIYCCKCNTYIGWKYVCAYEPSQKYKEGKYMLERNLLIYVQ